MAELRYPESDVKFIDIKCLKPAKKPHLTGPKRKLIKDAECYDEPSSKRHKGSDILIFTGVTYEEMEPGRKA